MQAHDVLDNPSRATAVRVGRGRRLLFLAAAIATIVSTAVAGAEAAKPPAGPPDFGPNVQKVLNGSVTARVGMLGTAKSWKLKLFPDYTVVVK